MTVNPATSTEESFLIWRLTMILSVGSYALCISLPQCAGYVTLCNTHFYDYVTLFNSIDSLAGHMDVASCDAEECFNTP